MVGKAFASENTQEKGHRSVMVAEALDGLAIKPKGTYVDATFGAGGHSSALLAQLGEAGRVMAFDADGSCANFANSIEDDRLSFVHANYREMENSLKPGSIDGVLMDLGLSMLQLSDGKRGFSIQNQGPLDMRFDTSKGKKTLAEKLRNVSEKELGKILREYGEERRWRRHASAILRRRRDKHLVNTTDLASACTMGRHSRWQQIHPATRVFQALRIWVNDELSSLIEGLKAATNILRPGGRLVVISFHSLEDRIVKRFLKPQDGTEGPLVPVGKLLRPTEKELSENRAARSAKLRVGEKK